MVNNNFYVMLEKEWFYVPEERKEEQTLLQKYETNSLMVYSIILRNLTNRNTFNFSIDGICSTLLIDKRSNNIMVKKIKKSIQKLNNNLFVVCSDSNCNNKADISKINNGTTYYCIRKNEPLKDKFIMVYDTEVDKMIVYSKGKKNSLAELITHYVFIVNGFKGMSEKEKKEEKVVDGYACYFGSMEYITSRTGITTSTLMVDNKIFIEQQLLLIGNAGGAIVDNNYTNTSNIYCRFENKIEFDKFMKINKARVGKKFANAEDKVLQDKQRRLKQFINKYKKEIEVDENTTKDDLTVEEFETLHKLEKDYYDFVISRDKKPVKPKFITITQDGIEKELYVPEEEAEEEYIPPEDKGKGLLTKSKDSHILPPADNTNHVVIMQTRDNPTSEEFGIKTKNSLKHQIKNKGLSDEIRLRKVHEFILGSIKYDKELKAKIQNKFKGRMSGLIGNEIEALDIEIHQFINNYNNNKAPFPF